eukprot:8271746-Karenia_brevis.AAC.1
MLVFFCGHEDDAYPRTGHEILDILSCSGWMMRVTNSAFTRQDFTGISNQSVNNVANHAETSLWRISMGTYYSMQEAMA